MTKKMIEDVTMVGPHAYKLGFPRPAMTPDSWIDPATACLRLIDAGYQVRTDTEFRRRIEYVKTGVSGRITIHPKGVDELAIFRLEDRGS